MVDLRDGVLIPGLVDTHVHFPQVRAIGALGMPLLEWLDKCALPEECRLASSDYARAVAAEFCSGLISAGTTSALVFGSHFAGAVDALFTEAARLGLRVTSGLVVSDRSLPDDLLTTPQRAYDEAVGLAGRWHGVGRNRYAVTPRFSLSASEPILDACSSVLDATPAQCSPPTSTRTAPRSPSSPTCSRLHRLRRHLRPTRPAEDPSGARAQRSSHRSGSSPSSPTAGRRWRTARRATPPSAAGCSRCVGT